MPPRDIRITGKVISSGSQTSHTLPESYERYMDLLTAIVASCPANSRSISCLLPGNIEPIEWQYFHEGWPCIFGVDAECIGRALIPQCGAWLREFLLDLARHGFFTRATVEVWVELGRRKNEKQET
jgi:hypothetical protein